MRKVAFIILLILVAVGCSKNPSGPTTDEILDSGGVSLVIISGNNQIGTVADTLGNPCIVEVRSPGGESGSGNVLPGVLVNFVVAEGGGSVFAGTAITDDAGRAADLWILGTTAGPQKMQVRAVKSDGTPVVYETFESTAEPGPPTEISTKYFEVSGFVGAPRILGDFVRGIDQYGNEIPRGEVDCELEVLGDHISISRDTLWADIETEGQLQIQSGDVYKEIPIYFFYDLRNFEWTIEYAATQNADAGIESMQTWWTSSFVAYPCGGADIWNSSWLPVELTLDVHYTTNWTDGTITESDSTDLSRTLWQAVNGLGGSLWYDAGAGTGITGPPVDYLQSAQTGLPRVYSCDLGPWLSYPVLSTLNGDLHDWASFSIAIVIGTPKP